MKAPALAGNEERLKVSYNIPHNIATKKKKKKR